MQRMQRTQRTHARARRDVGRDAMVQERAVEGRDLAGRELERMEIGRPGCRLDPKGRLRSRIPGERHPKVDLALLVPVLSVAVRAAERLLVRRLNADRRRPLHMKRRRRAAARRGRRRAISRRRRRRRRLPATLREQQPRLQKR